MFGRATVPVVTTAIHAGHDLRPAVAALIALSPAERLREEDPFTDELTEAGAARVVVHRSRFEVDVNRARGESVYLTPDASWGLEVWAEPLPEEEVESSRRLHDAFYDAMTERLDALARAGPFLLLDLHSYNHCREGPGRPPAPPDLNPEVNVGTGSLDRERWAGVVGELVDGLSAQQVRGHALDVRENVRFKGGYLTHWVNERYDGTGCALALEFKKTFMDEWTGAPDRAHLGELTKALSATIARLLGALAA
jgi:N-formylglutamate amidohydrolase